MHLLLLSTYELGAQPLGLARPAALFAGAGYEVLARDLAVEAIGEGDLEWADALVCSVPMHTALRLALAALDVIRADHPDLVVALHGLYAPVGAPALRAGDLAVAGEADDVLLEWAASVASRGLKAAVPALAVPRRPGPPSAASGPARRLGAAGPTVLEGPSVRVELGRPRRDSVNLGHPGRASLTAHMDRSHLPPLDRYARLISDGPDRLVGTVETTRGCSHRCRHCPVPTVYDGRTRAVELDAVLADVSQLVAAGAQHVHFADPDFLNRPSHALRAVRSLHELFPSVSFDATIKVSHILGHRDVIAELGSSGCVFVVSAFESMSDVVLERLDKGHRAAEAGEAVAVLRSAGIEPRPSFLPFTPWTTLRDLVELLDFVAAYDLVESVDPVQYGIRLLLPPGSLLLDRPDPALSASLGPYDAAHLGWSWAASDPALDNLQRAIAVCTEDGACRSEPAATTYASVRELVFRALGERDPGAATPAGPHVARARPHLSESWFCCAEPTSLQLGAVGAGLAGTP